MNFEDIEYLKYGTERQQAAYNVLKGNTVFERLKTFTPLLTGTIPLNIDTENSDLDICCYWADQEIFISSLYYNFCNYSGFRLKQKQIKGFETVISNFETGGFQFEVFGQNRPVKEQEAFRHLITEHLLLNKYGEEFRQKVIKLKKEGLKTEPAFAKVLGLKGDPYKELLDINVSFLPAF